MKSKWQLFASIFQLLIGAMAIIAFLVVGFAFFEVDFIGESVTRWIISLILAVAFVVLGILGIIDYKAKR